MVQESLQFNAKNKMNLKHFHNHRVHLIGIGGIGMSAIAEILSKGGVKVQGSDVSETYITEHLKKIGVEVTIGHSPDNLKDASLIIRSTAIKDDNIEIIEAKRRFLKILHRAEALAEILNGLKTVAITGTHGKSTTTALTGAICFDASLRPIIVNGAFINQFSSNVLTGTGNLAVIESDESDESFLVPPSDLAVVTNMDAEHLDYYGSVERMQASYKKFILKTIDKGPCFICNDHLELSKLSKNINNSNIITYAINTEADIKASNIEVIENGTKFNLIFNPTFAEKFSVKSLQENNLFLSLYGQHNVYNALAALGIGLTLGINIDKIRESLRNFGGVKRRFTKVGIVDGVMIVDDYAHHPAEIQATFSVARHIAKMRSGDVIAVMQPHRYSRLIKLMDEFAASFTDADFVILTEVYGAGEAKIENVNSEILRDKIIRNGKEVVGICHQYDELKPMLQKIAKPNDIVIMIGAGDITKWSYKLAASSRLE
ncbi:MAG: UDP-N-acetylmuramate--L-alanine ligase [Candidatus Midichloria sp.]|uniref:UDP-N-acetylmuramate--L-alanine ligase n=1 Tax=Hyalomma marginatum TaxID=34627 RepID=A0A8S4C1P3_9ACAR|nr:UDP-N-acetylmuramate--L-alanine ligase [Hyalomma marginatum]CAG7600533.1 UDP-N-acetylmuramate--L-alanine ligase [Hyalomma marginatum]